MLRSVAAVLTGTLLLSWVGQSRDMSFREQMVPVSMANGHLLQVSPIEVTLADWMRCVRENACDPALRTKSTSQSQPMTGVNWLDVQQYLTWANKRAGGGLRLPTQEEWLWLHRSLAKPKPAPLFTDPRLAWAASYGQEETSGGPVRPSGFFSKTPDGISDLDGNVWEWTSTCAAPGYGSQAGAKCPAFFAEGLHEATIPEFLRKPASGGCATGTPPNYLGFRLVSDGGNGFSVVR
jgi:formylglycine-generating enzyme required for sulfatase activity